MATTMPYRGQNTAPQFSPEQPRELRRYFEELDRLLAAAAITTTVQQKEYACRYLDIDTAELWEQIPEFQPTSSYVDFKTAVIKLYPGAEGDRRYSVADMDSLIGERARLGIYSVTDLGTYHRSFYMITKFLIGKGRLSDTEVSRAFLRGFQPELAQKIAVRLEIKLPDHHPDDPYDLNDVHAAAEFVVQRGNTSTAMPKPTSAKMTEPSVKTEDLTNFLDKFAQTLIKALAPVTQQNAPSSSAFRPPYQRLGESDKCHFCGQAGHMLMQCEIVEQFIRDGKIRRNAENKIVLPGGAYVPRIIPGNYLGERVDEWHRRNPGQLATGHLNSNANPDAGQLMFAVTPVAPPTAPIVAQLQNAIITPVPLSVEQRIEVLQHEIYQLRTRRKVYDGVEILRRVRPSDSVPSGPETAPSSPRANTPTPAERILPSRAPTPIPDIYTEATRATKEAAKGKAKELPLTAPIPVAPDHPFANVRDANYGPPKDRNFATSAPFKTTKDSQTAYRTVIPIQNPQIATDIFARAMRSSITLSSEELLSLSPEVRTKYRDAISAKRIIQDTSSKDAEPNTQDVDHDLTTFHLSAELPFQNDPIGQQTPPPNSLIIPDPYEMYLNSLKPGEMADMLVVAKESHALRSILPLVDNREHVESIVDPGSQIIAMSEDVCHDLHLIYDPSIRLKMQSANGDIDESLGLARNVAFKIGDITIYLQVHVLRAPAYDILLGRPFDVLTESVVKNFKNEDQTITIHDPNTGRLATIPTMPRGPPRHKARPVHHSMDFRLSRN